MSKTLAEQVIYRAMEIPTAEDVPYLPISAAVDLLAELENGFNVLEAHLWFRSKVSARIAELKALEGE